MRMHAYTRRRTRTHSGAAEGQCVFPVGVLMGPRPASDARWWVMDAEDAARPAVPAGTPESRSKPV